MRDPAVIIAILLINVLAATTLSLLLRRFVPEAFDPFIGPTLTALGATWSGVYVWRSVDHE